ncbi:MAG: PilZ domain-containing protein [Myxococcales bacterium]
MRGARTQGDGTVRFRVAYSRPEALLEEFTHSVNRGGSPLTVTRPVPVGTRFIFELLAGGVGKPVEVYAEVLSQQALGNGRYRVNLGYLPGGRGGLDEVVIRTLESQKHEWTRKAPRIPLNMRATEETPYSPGYLVRDMSLGGAGFEVEATTLPKSVTLGAPMLLELAMKGDEKLRLRGVVVWALQGRGKRSPLNSSFGVQFVEDLDFDSLEMLDRVVSFKSSPRSARVTFGSEAY